MNADAKPMTEHLIDRYDVSVVDDKRDVSYQRTKITLTAKKRSCLVLLNNADIKSVMLAAVVCDDYTLEGSRGPICVRLSNGQTAIEGTDTYMGTQWSHVFFPRQSSVTSETCGKVLFQPSGVHMTAARRLFPNLNESTCMTGIKSEEDVVTKITYWKLSVDIDSEGNYVCPLGYTLGVERKFKDAYGVELTENTHNGVKSRYYLLPKAHGETALAIFKKSVQDPRPNVHFNVFKIEAAKGLPELEEDFVLNLELGIFYYPS